MKDMKFLLILEAKKYRNWKFSFVNPQDLNSICFDTKKIENFQVSQPSEKLHVLEMLFLSQKVEFSSLPFI